MRTTTRALIGAAAVLALAGCGGPVAAGTGTNPAAGGSAASPNAAQGTTIMAASVTGHGSVVVVAATGRTLYQFAKDVAGSGTSACTSQCITKWPALTVPAGTPPTAAAGLAGQLGTITRSDNGETQVTYNGLPVYIYSGDSNPGDSNGNYPEWSVIAADSSSSSGGGAAPSATAGATGVGGY